MPRYDFRTPRLFVEQPIEAGRSLELSRAQANYLRNVLRRSEGEPMLVFNGRDGAWRASIRYGRNTALEVLERTRPQTAAANDRLIVIDRHTAWPLTQSLNKFAERSPGSIEKTNPEATDLKIPAYEAMWTSATPL